MAPATTKRKASSPESSGDEDEDQISPVAAESSSAAASRPLTKTRAGSELVPSSKPGEPPVTKRTLQNRKAQREFRKRREARVKELEERCRRFDQMGLEANAELQAMARQLKDENEALRSLLVRLGYGALIDQALNGDFAAAAAAADASGAANAGGGGLSSHHHSRSSSARGSNSSGAGNDDTKPTTASLQSFPPAPPGSVNPNLLDPTSGLGGGYPHHHQQQHQQQQHQQGNAAMNVRWSPQQPQQQHSQSQDWSSMQPQSTQQRRGSDGRDQNPLLSLDLSGGAVDNNGQDGQRHPGGGRGPSRTPGGSVARGGRNEDYAMTPGTFSSLMGMLVGGNNQQGQQQHANSPHGGGSAFIRTPTGMQQHPHQQHLGQQGQQPVHPTHHNHVPFAHRPHHNDALLNPNPIPFALNLSNEPVPDQSWWDRNGGGTFGGDSFLDEKAQAVAQAQASSSQGAMSPFDLSSFLNAGAYGGGNGAGMNMGSLGMGTGMPTGYTPALAGNNDDPLSQAGADLKMRDESAAASSSGKSGKGNGKASTGGSDNPANNADGAQQQPPLNPAEHVQTFLRLLERQAIRATTARANAGRGSMSGKAANKSTPWMDMGSDAASSASSSGNDSPEDGGTTPTGSDRRSSTNSSREMITPNAAYSRLASHPAFLYTSVAELEALVGTINDASIATVQAQGSGSGAPLELNANALQRMRAMLDEKMKRGGRGAMWPFEPLKDGGVPKAGEEGGEQQQHSGMAAAI
ncbi:hypothetical protein BDZ90DRAFT_276098 [Jaminaea rosea]|uniref:BZIP domain-containing protein n=1 Tax=Jaminaea rosea TaxID=1569628 RepID=A0A316ULW4_9BASI|nr:hypothetical protein BDZ90DRAFT_276098 [Jaminaea rosea]PWN24923.1 hypothetical protein BDZ90DRAFT_276098 [Jaminaea rosea]